ncbi:MAG: MATE family efflux transporter [Parvularculaceae bacterium]
MNAAAVNGGAAKRAVGAAWRTEFAALFSLGLPMALTQLAQFSVMTIDILMIGRLGPEPLAGASLGLVMFFIAWLVGFGPAMAVSPLVSQALGADENDTEDARLSTRMALWTIGFLTLPVFILFFLAKDIALALGQPPELAKLAGPYVIALAPGWAFAMGTITLRNFLAAIGESRAPLLIVICTTALNAFLNWLLIYGNWGFPRFELVGAGIASSIVNVTGFFGLVLYIELDARSRRFRLFRDFFTPHWLRLREVIRLSWPIAVAMTFEGMLFNAAVFLMGRIGVNEVAAYQVALNVAALAFMGPMGFSMAGGVRVGLAAGAGDGARVRRAAALTMIVAVAAIMSVAIPVYLAPNLVAALYLKANDAGNAMVIPMVASFLRIAALFMLFDAIQVAAAQALRGLKDVRIPMFITGIAYWVVGFPVAALLGLGFRDWAGVGANGVWWGLMAGLFVAAGLLGGRLYWLTRRR